MDASRRMSSIRRRLRYAIRLFIFRCRIKLREGQNGIHNANARSGAQGSTLEPAILFGSVARIYICTRYLPGTFGGGFLSVHPC